MSSHAEQHTLYQIANAPLRLHPYPHILVQDVFEPAFYRMMVENLLPENLMQPIKAVRPVSKGYSDERFVFPLEKERLGTLPAPRDAFWGELAGWLLGVPFAGTVLQKFAPFVEERFRDQDPGIYSEAMLVDDRARYSLGPHTDTPAKVITLLFYLPEDASSPHLGTSLYVPRERSFRCPGGPHHPFELFDLVTTMPYLPNTLFAFFKTDNSFHGVEPVKEEACRRRLLFYDIKCKLEDLPAAQPKPGKPGVEFTF